MAPTHPSRQQPGKTASDSRRKDSSREKLPRLPEGTRIQKRALARSQQPISSKSKLIYVSSSTPFMAAVSRVRKQLDRSIKGNVPSTKGMSLPQRVDLLHRDGGTKTEGEAVVLGTGKAIEKVLSVAAWFTEQRDCEVEVRTRTVGTVDDVVVEDDDAGFGGDEVRGRKPYYTERLNSSKTEIRLLEIVSADDDPGPIRCRLRTVKLNDRPVFFALSYLWGDAAQTTPIQILIKECSEKKAPIKRKCLHRLTQLSTSKPPYVILNFLLWVDAVCIDQADLEERSEQLGLMQRIYSSATCVLSWLGTQDRAVAFKAIQGIYVARVAAGSDEEFFKMQWMKASPVSAVMVVMRSKTLPGTKSSVFAVIATGREYGFSKRSPPLSGCSW
ncbi:hypothetical protein CkaCkLH20_07387 [Colletotrichum karsti]|uniref:Heterokaryon incompatibility domain-containing protein n=1 Tax=Colletotrichum karsti TaxID=1095194 RepID=A0A9P6I6Y5_9PEZI|nr:uncharacterized protein CkaCkLH20_07387 [Colletotrichum karsti]KAF9875121.1 hypothetical protein CkaCkLH20_07387 [Colletotrichum karsti]